MKRSWVLIVLSVFLILALAGCTLVNDSASAPEQPQPTPEPAMDSEMDSDMDEDAAHSTDDEESEEADTEEADTEEADTEEADTDTEEDLPAIDAAALFAENCARCHGANREGGGAPPLLPGRLTKDPSVYVNTINVGPGPMPAFGETLTVEEIDALLEFILSEPQ